MDRLYIVVRGDLPPGLQAAQAVHAAFQFYQAHPEITEKWLVDSNYLVILAVPDEDTLIRLYTEANMGRDLRALMVREPDLGDEATAVALEPGEGSQALCAQLPLALRYTVDMEAQVAS